MNRPNGVGFDEIDAATSGGQLGTAGSGRAQADFTLLEGESGATEYPVSVARFAHTNNVSLVLVRWRRVGGR